MDMSRVMELGGKEDWISLSSELLSTESRHVVKLVTRGLVGREGPLLLRHLLSGLGAGSSRQLEEVRDKVVEIAVKQVCSNMCLPNKSAAMVLETVGGEMDKFGTESLVRLVDLCMGELEKSEKSETSFRWLPLLGRLLEAVEGRETIMVDGLEEEKGPDYKLILVRQICALRWGRDLVTPLSAMMKEVKLETKEMEEVFDKFCDTLATLPAQEVPPLVYQLLLLCKTSGSLCGTLVAHLNRYFVTETRHRGGENETNMDLDSIEMLDSNQSTEEELQQAGSNVVFHITQATALGHPVARQLVKLVKTSTHAPEIVLNNFSLFLCLALTSVKQWRLGLLDSLRQTLAKCFLLEEKRQSSAWLRSTLPTTGDIFDLLSLIISQSSRAGGWDLIVQGLVDLGLALLDMQPQLGKMDRRLRSVHHLGSRLLLKVLKKQGVSSAQSIIGPLTDRILNHRSNPQYTEALRVILRDTATLLMENPSVVNCLLDNLTGLNFQSARRSLVALMPLVRFSRHLRDSVILVVRKALFSRAVSARQTAVTGVLLLLRTFKLSTSRAVSQLSQSSGSLSQLAVEVHRGGTQGGTGSNDALCSELVGVLKRCFSLQPQVRLTLYQGLNEVVAKNPELVEGTLELIFMHVLDLLGLADDAWEVDLNKTVVETGEVGGWVVEDPAGWFLHCVVVLVGRAQQLLEEDDSDNLDKLVKLLDRMTEGYSNCDVSELGFEVTDNFDLKTLEGERKSLKMDVLLTVFEALMEYVITHGGDTTKEQAEVLLKLQRNHSALSNLRSSALARKTKGGKKGDKKDEEGEKTETVGPKRGRPGLGSGDNTKFVMPKHALSLKSLSIVLKTMVERTGPAGSLLYEDSQFPRYLLDVVAAKLDQTNASLASYGDEGPQSDILFRYLSSITSSLFSHSVSQSEDSSSTLTSPCLLQVLKLLLTLFPRRRLALLSCLGDTINPGDATEDNLNPVLVPVMKLVMKKVSALKDAFIETEEIETVDRLGTTVEIFSLLMGEMDDREGVDEVRKWISMLCKDMGTSEPKMLEPLVRLYLLSIVKLKEKHNIGQELAQQFHSLIGDVEPQVMVEEVNTYPWLDKNTKETIFPLLLDHLEVLLDNCDMSISWMKSLTSNDINTTSSLTTAETSLCTVLARQVNAATELVKTAFSLGSNVDAVLKLVTKLYTVTTNLTKHFIVRSKDKKTVVQTTKFDKVVVQINSQLTKYVYEFITFIENKQKERDLQAAANRAAKNKTVDPTLARGKVLRESRYIPNIILKVEMMHKDIIKLGKRVGQNLCEGSRATISRDFRIKISDDLAEKLNDEESSDDDDDASGDDDEPSTVNDGTAMEDITNSTRADDTTQEPSSKKSKLGRKKENLSKLSN